MWGPEGHVEKQRTMIKSYVALTEHNDLPLAWIIFKWSTVICRISAFSNLAEPCFSNALGTRRFSSERDMFIRSRRFFSITPRRFFRDNIWQLSASPGDVHLEKWNGDNKNTQKCLERKMDKRKNYKIKKEFLSFFSKRNILIEVGSKY